MMKYEHKPVLLNEVLEAFDYLNNIDDAVFVDGTVGLAGHSLAIARQAARNKTQDTNKSQLTSHKIIGIDKDEAALKSAKLKVESIKLRNHFLFVHDDFHNIDQILTQLKIDSIDGMLLDLGVSSMQLDDKKRGFSFENMDAPLDMRMDPTQTLTAKDILNTYLAVDLEEILKRGEEKYYRNITAKIVQARREKPFETVGDLVSVIEIAVPNKHTGKNIATGAFRALRIEVNDELVPLGQTIEAIIPHLKTGARLAIISFHTLEDRIVKQTFRKLENPCTCPPEFPYCTCGKKPEIKIITKKPTIPSDHEIAENLRARSAKMRIIEKVK